MKSIETTKKNSNNRLPRLGLLKIVKNNLLDQEKSKNSKTLIILIQQQPLIKSIIL